MTKFLAKENIFSRDRQRFKNYKQLFSRFITPMKMSRYEKVEIQLHLNDKNRLYNNDVKLK
jgi:hypothetical protein